jgi:hypothetical protein
MAVKWAFAGWQVPLAAAAAAARSGAGWSQHRCTCQAQSVQRRRTDKCGVACRYLQSCMTAHVMQGHDPLLLYHHVSRQVT